MPVRVPHRVVVAPSSFKESLSAEAVAAAIAAGVRRTLPGADVFVMPVVDGGEGSAATMASATGGRLVPYRVRGPVGEPVTAELALLGGEGPATAVVEMATAAGLRLVPRDRRDPTRTTTYGVGELIRAALDLGVEQILVGCGDSGTSDGGAGALQALGARLLDAQGKEVSPVGGGDLEQVARIDLSELDPRLRRVRMEIGCNMGNVLCGPGGVARVFAPQKGATPEQVDRLAAALESWAHVLEDARQGAGDTRALDVRHGPGTGASGGLGAGLAAVCGGRLRSRFEVFLGEDMGGARLDRAISETDLVITAEGAVDHQTPRGKVPAEIARRANLYGKPVVALAGSIGWGAGDVHDVGVDAVIGIIPVPMKTSEAFEQAEELLTRAAERTMRLVVLGAVIASQPGDPA